MMRLRVPMLAVLAVLSVEAAWAAEPAAVEEARKHFARSKELYEDGDLAGALNELERSYRAVPNFKLLYNMGQIQAQQQNHAGALRAFRRFLLDGSNEIGDARRAEVLKEVDKLRTRVAELTISVSVPGAEIMVDEMVVGTSPLADPVVVNVGRRKVSATLTDYFPATKQVDVGGLETLRVALDLRPMATAAATLTPPVPTPANVAATPGAATGAPEVARVVTVPEKPSRMPTWLPWAGTAALGVGAVATGLTAMDLSKKQAALIETYGVSAAQLSAAAAKTRSMALTADILAGCTGAAALGSLLFTLLRAPEDAPAPAAVQVGVGPNSILVTGAF